MCHVPRCGRKVPWPCSPCGKLATADRSMMVHARLLPGPNGRHQARAGPFVDASDRCVGHEDSAHPGHPGDRSALWRVQKSRGDLKVVEVGPMFGGIGTLWIPIQNRTDRHSIAHNRSDPKSSETLCIPRGVRCSKSHRFVPFGSGSFSSNILFVTYSFCRYSFGMTRSKSFCKKDTHKLGQLMHRTAQVIVGPYVGKVQHEGAVNCYDAWKLNSSPIPKESWKIT